MKAEDKIYSLIKDLADGRVYPEQYNQGDLYPGIVYLRTGSEIFKNMCLVIEDTRVIIRLEIYAKTIEETVTICDEIINRCKYEHAINNIYNDIDIERDTKLRVMELSVWDD